MVLDQHFATLAQLAFWGWMILGCERRSYAPGGFSSVYGLCPSGASSKPLRRGVQNASRHCQLLPGAETHCSGPELFSGNRMQATYIILNFLVLTLKKRKKKQVK